MTNTETHRTEDINQLHSFAVKHERMPFAHLCTAALNRERHEGKEWAVDRLIPVIAEIDAIDYENDAQVLAVIDRVDTRRPDGGVARGGVQQPAWLRAKLGI